MLKSEMQHQFWVTKKAMQRKLGSKEDKCIVSSDAELDAKIELFKSISESCSTLYKIIDQYQERLCILSQEENSLGKFLKEAGKRSNTTGKNMVNSGKTISYCGQQRMTIRIPLIRLHHEVEVFQCRAVADTQSTINLMEKERTEYRAALSWMKSASSQLDPDTGKGLDKFRKSQNQVRLAKSKFDRLSLDCIQKIDLLAAARCNMFSHALVAYMHAILQFSKKASDTLKTISATLSVQPQYDFCILKDLTQTLGKMESNTKISQSIGSTDTDKYFFFSDDYQDEKLLKKPEQSEVTTNLVQISQSSNNDYLISTNLDQLLKPLMNQSTANNSETGISDKHNVEKNFTLSTNKLSQHTDCKQGHKLKEASNSQKKVSSWLQLFSELDPLSNPDSFVQKVNGGEINSQEA